MVLPSLSEFCRIIRVLPNLAEFIRVLPNLAEFVSVWPMLVSVWPVVTRYFIDFLEFSWISWFFMKLEVFLENGGLLKTRVMGGGVPGAVPRACTMVRTVPSTHYPGYPYTTHRRCSWPTQLTPHASTGQWRVHQAPFNTNTLTWSDVHLLNP